MLLIRFLRRGEAISSSVCAVIYNRVRDIRIMLMIIGVNS